jgi:endonuclease YncB( thermonuclease family)
LVIALTGLAVFAAAGPPHGSAHDSRARVAAVVDGDTIRVRARGTVRTVWLLGIDAPGRTECGGRQALSNLLELTFTQPFDSDGDHFFDRGGGTGRRVTMTRDATRRTGAYVATIAGTRLQEDQLIRGWARARDGRFSRAARYRRIEAQARAVSHGAWSKCGGDFHRPAIAPAYHPAP